MKKIIFALLSAATFSANACGIDVLMENNSWSTFRKYGGWVIGNNLSDERYHAACEKLKKANAKIYVLGSGTVLAGMSIGWAALTVRDKNMPIQSEDYAMSATRTNTYASQDVADELFVQAINQALNEWDLDQALVALNKARAQIKLAKHAR